LKDLYIKGIHSDLEVHYTCSRNSDIGNTKSEIHVQIEAKSYINKAFNIQKEHFRPNGGNEPSKFFGLFIMCNTILCHMTRLISLSIL
jgi:hypothetical protein